MNNRTRRRLETMALQIEKLERQLTDARERKLDSARVRALEELIASEKARLVRMAG